MVSPGGGVYFSLNSHHFFSSQISSNPLFSLFYSIPLLSLFFYCLEMLPKFMSPFKGEPREGKRPKLGLNQKRKPGSGDGGRRSHLDPSETTITTTMDVIGLRLLTQITNSKSQSNVLVKSALRKGNQTSCSLDFCFLKTCNLCNKQLSQDKDIYMYRGDQGFCSIECRNRQIVLDEMRELEGSTKQRATSYRHCWNDAQLETRLILEDLRLQRHQSKPIPCAQNHWAIAS